ncbi:MAG: PadR family transcriptional regulator [Sphingobacteriaceae bacterium]|nr:MAG: PadR family transcriptional regulator [Sphingobacteriaceae bacterium]
MANVSKELLAATSIPLILSVLKRGESYGYELIKEVKEASGGTLQFSDGTLYPILRKLEERELITSEWRIADNEKRRRYYNITDKGKTQLKQEKKNWEFLNGLLSTLWTPAKTNLT